MRKKGTLESIKRTAKAVVPKGATIYLFGSRARGDERSDSDWDILIILPKERLNQSDYDQVSYPFVELGWMLGERINPIVYTNQEWEANSITPFYDNVRRDAVSLL
ncbi:MAG: nucleotidyltransferase domain-containing protein [Bacteroidaceae bacterium]|nr:nucleotidyltransferase domain-containing protein [Bacteroidaceae bacterium]